MAEADNLQRELLNAQNGNGGWGYRSNSSWTEPTALALLALEAHSLIAAAYEQGCAWLRHNQRSDGGWAPNPTIETSTWVTSLSVLALSHVDRTSDGYARAVEWIVRQIKPEPGSIEQFIFRMTGLSPQQQSGGSPWFSGTAAWIGPTVMTVLALSEAGRYNNDGRLRSYVKRGRGYVLSTRCPDGGWNHGGSRFRSETAESYPEMTGMALVALQGIPASQLGPSIERANAYLTSPGSIEALSWLQMGLLRYDGTVLKRKTKLPCRTTRDISLRLLALAAGTGRNRLLTAS